jgi:hypothetical protein
VPVATFATVGPGIGHGAQGGVTLAVMLALLDDDRLAALLDRRHAWGADGFDEVWEGVRHHPPVGPHSALQQALALALRDRAQQRGLTPVLGAFDPRDPDAGRRHPDAEPLLRGDMAASAALAVEIVPAPDATEPRLAALAADRVDEVGVVDLRRREVTCLALLDGGYRSVERSALLGLDAAALAPLMSWPALVEE